MRDSVGGHQLQQNGIYLGKTTRFIIGHNFSIPSDRDAEPVDDVVITFVKPGDSSFYATTDFFQTKVFWDEPYTPEYTPPYFELFDINGVLLGTVVVNYSSPGNSSQTVTINMPGMHKLIFHPATSNSNPNYRGYCALFDIEFNTPVAALANPLHADVGVSDEIVTDAGESVVLDASLSSNSNGANVTRYRWRRLPDHFTLNYSFNPIISVKALGRISECLQLTVWDDQGNRAIGNLKLIHPLVQAMQNFQGPAGPVGEAGPQGPLGEQGPMGPQGPAGDKGLTGDSGSVGPQGAVGPQGPTGNQGPTGDKGSTGDQGPQGSAGEQGPMGVQGPVGDKGPMGDKGLTGDQGLQGPIGEQGSVGPQGPVGNKGPTGDKGPKGDKGSKGDKGPTGDKGPKGDKGPRGDKGPSGK